MDRVRAGAKATAYMHPKVGMNLVQHIISDLIKTLCYVTEAILELTKCLRLASNPQSLCLSFVNTAMTGMCHHVHLSCPFSSLQSWIALSPMLGPWRVSDLRFSCKLEYLYVCMCVCIYIYIHTYMCAQTHTTCSGDRHSKPGRRREASRFSSYRNAPTLGWGATVCFIPVVWDRILLFKPGWLSVSNLLPWPVIVGLRKCIIKSTYF